MATTGTGKMGRSGMILVILSSFALLCSAVEQMVVVQAPDYMNFQPGENVRLSQMPDILSGIWGFTTVKDQKWNGLTSGNPLKRPEAIVVVEIEGCQRLQLDLPGKEFPLECDVEPGWPYQLAADRVYVRFAEDSPVLMEVLNDDSIYAMKSQYSALLQKLPARPSDLEDSATGPNSIASDPLDVLNVSLTPDLKCLMDIQLLVETARIMEQKSAAIRDGIPDLFWFRIPCVQELISVYGSGSPQVQEAMKLAMKAVNELKTRFTKAYDGHVVICILGVDYQAGGMVRLSRSLLAADTKKDETKSGNLHNVATFYSAGYPAAFNIIFLTMLIFSLAVFAIALAMWHIDPGRDSIIYRMTSQRMKKDQ